MWAEKENASSLADGVEVINRNDYNYSDVADGIVRTVLEYAKWDNKTVETARRNAAALSEKALWKNFIAHYYQAYDIALRNAEIRKETL